MYIIKKDPSPQHEDKAPCHALQVANWFIKRAKRDNRILSIMSILKLSYIAHGKFLAKYNTPLFLNRIEAWQYGPVIVDIYTAFRNQGRNVSQPLDNWQDIEVPSPADDPLENVWQEYGNIRAFKLSLLTHVEGGPWDIASDIGGWYTEIPNKLIRKHYLVKEAAHD